MSFRKVANYQHTTKQITAWANPDDRNAFMHSSIRNGRQKSYGSLPTIKKYKSAPDTQNYLILHVKGITGPVSLFESLQYLGGWSWCNGAARLYGLTCHGHMQPLSVFFGLTGLSGPHLFRSEGSIHENMTGFSSLLRALYLERWQLR